MALTSNQQDMHDRLNAILNKLIEVKANCDDTVSKANQYGATQAAGDCAACSAAIAPFIALLTTEVAIYNDLSHEG